MRVVHLVAGELTGGAARGAYWLHHALREIGVDSSLLGNSRQNRPDESVYSLVRSATAKAKQSGIRRLGLLPLRLYRDRPRLVFNTGFEGINFTRHPAYQSADIVHLHWVNGLVSTGALARIDKPVVWTLRDMWPFTGGCHQSTGCERFTGQCGRCPQLGSEKDSDLSRYILRRKQRSLPAHLRVIGISTWISEIAERSSVFSGSHVSTISNNVDTRAFEPVDRRVARQALGIDDGRKVVLTVAPRVTQSYAETYKGFDLFQDAVAQLDSDKLHVLMFGSESARLDVRAASVTNLGFLGDTTSLRLAYSAADVFVAPTRADAFGKTLAEAMACGTPVVCFDATGPRDIVEDRASGYRATPFDSADMARGVRWILEQSESEYARMCKSARDRAVRLFDSRVIARQYRDVYGDMLGAGSD